MEVIYHVLSGSGESLQITGNLLNDFMGLDLSPHALAELTSQYAVAIPQPVSVCRVVGLSRIMFMCFSLLWKADMLELQDVSSKCQWSACFSHHYSIDLCQKM